MQCGHPHSHQQVLFACVTLCVMFPRPVWIGPKVHKPQSSELVLCGSHLYWVSRLLCQTNFKKVPLRAQQNLRVLHWDNSLKNRQIFACKNPQWNVPAWFARSHRSRCCRPWCRGAQSRTGSCTRAPSDKSGRWMARRTSCGEKQVQVGPGYFEKVIPRKIPSNWPNFKLSSQISNAEVGVQLL